MKRRLPRIAGIVSTILMFAVLALWTISYWRAIFVGHRDTTWTTLKQENRSVSVGFRNGRVVWIKSHYAESTNLFLPEKWATLTPDAQQRLLAYKNAHAEFHGWDYLAETVSLQDPGRIAYASALGLTYSKLAPGDGYIVCVPAWMLVALLGLPGARWLHRHYITRTRREFPVDMNVSPAA